MKAVFEMHKSGADLIVAQEKRWGEVKWKPKGVVLHYTALPSPKLSEVVEHLRAIDNYHRMKRGFDEIGYHIAIHRSGALFECRPLHRRGAHTTAHNDTIGIVILGDNSDVQEENPVMWHSLKECIKAVCRRFDIPHSSVWLHRQLRYTQCPPLSVRFLNYLKKEFPSISLERKER